jgi:large subunit ribosomal protein L5
MSNRLQTIYKEEIRKSLQEKMNYKSSMEIPYITKITINVGLGQAVKDKKSS